MYRWRGFKPRQQWYKSESLLTLDQFELMRGFLYTDKSAVDCHATKLTFPIPATARLITEKQRIAFPITEIALRPVANMDKFTVNVAVDVPLKITDDDVRRFPDFDLTESKLAT